jgi:hypothetical protein
VKKIAAPAVSRTEKAGPDNLIIEPAWRKTEPYSGAARRSFEPTIQPSWAARLR